MFVLVNKKYREVLCGGDRITGSSFKPPFYRGKIRKAIIKWERSRDAEEAIKAIEHTDVCGSTKDVEVATYPSLWRL